MSSKVESKRTYFAIFGALMVLTGLTVGVSMIDFGGSLNIVLALTIAVSKALLVILFFMHVRESRPLTQITVAAGFLWLMIMLVLLMSDYLSRGWLSGPSPW